MLPCNGMLQGRDPLIIENNKKRGRQKTHSERCFLPFRSNKKKNAAFQAQSSTNKKKRIREQKGRTTLLW